MLQCLNTHVLHMVCKHIVKSYLLILRLWSILMITSLYILMWSCGCTTHAYIKIVRLDYAYQIYGPWVRMRMGDCCMWEGNGIIFRTRTTIIWKFLSLKWSSIKFYNALPDPCHRRLTPITFYADVISLEDVVWIFVC